jgi:hypothetical protein
MARTGCARACNRVARTRLPVLECVWYNIEIAIKLK